MLLILKRQPGRAQCRPGLVHDPVLLFGPTIAGGGAHGVAGGGVGEAHVADNNRAAGAQMVGEKAAQQGELVGQGKFVEGVGAGDTVERAVEVGRVVAQQVGLGEGGRQRGRGRGRRRWLPLRRL